MGETVRKIGRVVFWALVGVGVFFAGRDLWRWAVPVEHPQEVVQEVAPVGCLCSAGAECVGPKGGAYCLTDDGKKRYKGKQ